jgi:hypothetical protein
MAEEKKKVVLAMKTLQPKGSTVNYDRLVKTSPIPNFEEKHYLEKGSVPQDKTVYCVYYYEED